MKRVLTALAALLTLVGCSKGDGVTPVQTHNTVDQTTTQSTHANAEPCNLVSKRYVIIWQHEPNLLDNSIQLSDVDSFECKPMVETWRDYQPTGPGFCYAIAWADENPGYPVGARPSPPLKHVVDSMGSC
jgi:hypothetical protein